MLGKGEDQQGLGEDEDEGYCSSPGGKIDSLVIKRAENIEIWRLLRSNMDIFMFLHGQGFLSKEK